MKILVVDDSVVFRSQIKAALEGAGSLEVIGTANNGQIALQKLKQTPVDLITLDMEMPVMDGLSTIREIRKTDRKTKIIVFSSVTKRGSELTLEALSAGADDFVTKPSGEGLSIENAAEKIRQELVPKVLQFRSGLNTPGRFSGGVSSSTAPTVSSAGPTGTVKSSILVDTFRPSLIVIGSSTGGPAALQEAFVNIRPPLSCPVLIVQHMPPVFTASLAKRIQEHTKVPTYEAKNETPLTENSIYVAPGDYHMLLAREGGQVKILLNQKPSRNHVRPAVDFLFESAAEIYGKKVMAFILTGMGNDGLDGCRAVKNQGGKVMIQNRESCVVFGMPGVVYEAGLYDAISDLVGINQTLKRMTNN